MKNLKSILTIVGLVGLADCANHQSQAVDPSHDRIPSSEVSKLKPRPIKNPKWFPVKGFESTSGQFTMVCKEDVETPWESFKTNPDGTPARDANGKPISEGIKWEKSSSYHLVDSSKGRYRRLSRSLGECYFDPRGYGMVGATWAYGERIEKASEGEPNRFEYEGALVFLNNEFRKHSHYTVLTGSFYPEKKLPYGFRHQGTFSSVIGEKLSQNGKDPDSLIRNMLHVEIATQAKNQGFELAADQEIYFDFTGEGLYEYHDYPPYPEDLKKVIVERDYVESVYARGLPLDESSVLLHNTSGEAFSSTVSLFKNGKEFTAEVEAAGSYVIAIATNKKAFDSIDMPYLKKNQSNQIFELPIRNTNVTFYFKVVGSHIKANLGEIAEVK